MEDQLRSVVVVAFTGLLILLRFDAYRFGAAEYDDEAAPGGWRNAARRFTWYLIGVGLVMAIYFLHPRPITLLHLTPGGDRGVAIFLGLAFGALGVVVAAGYAWLRYQHFRLPQWRLYPGAIANSIGTALIDEVAFRGALMGMLLALSWPAELAIAFQAILYALATRLGAPGRSRGMLLISLLVAIATGWLTVFTGGIGAGFVGHAITRFAIFVTTGHAGQVRAPGHESEEEAAERRPPEGWEVVRESDRWAS
jgi:hypothetical protein